ncbi:phosphotransferase family protein [Mycolicibacterium aurum]|uniref:Phosphotransferase family protein n=1 Tax=Mycolicibacterium aurum TaxID=1791 RepID=A0A448IMG3_MYCAU|nr:phosphotransferase [Mycolicibacterium aurum]VEG53692.1 phosphotransferase family protein [Mycolicibacterium aurum]
MVSLISQRIGPVAGLASHLGRGLGRIGADTLVGRLRSFPRTIDDLDAATLSSLIGATVTSVSLIGGDAGTSSRARLALTGHAVPASVFVKMAAETVATRLMGELGNLADTETRFYGRLAPELTGVPRCYGRRFDPLSGRFVLILEDLSATTCEFPDTLHPIDADRAALVVELLARLHATFWDRFPTDDTGPLNWIYTASADSASLLTAPLLRMSSQRLAERTDLPLERGRFIDQNYRAAAALIDRPPHTVMHGDAHPGNLYFREGKAGLLDWQAVRRGHPSRELAYTLVTSMTTESRRESQRDLLDVYRGALAASGGPELDRDGLWDRYRQSALYPYVATMITAGMGGMQGADIAMKGLERSLEALADLDTVAAVKKAL